MAGDEAAGLVGATLADQAAAIEAALPGLVADAFAAYRAAADLRAENGPGAARAALTHLQGLLRLGRLLRGAAGPGERARSVDLAVLLAGAPAELEAEPDD